MVDALERHFVAQADPERAAQMATYMRDQFPFYGIGAADRKDIHRQVWGEFALPVDEPSLAGFARHCYGRPEREWHYTAVAALRRNKHNLTPVFLPLLHELVTTHSWWDTVDEIAAHLVGAVVARHPETTAVMDEWVRSDDMWVARTAILHQLTYKHTTDQERLFAYCDLCLDETDFFYRKAIGWALRQYARENPDAVWRYCDTRAERMAPLTRREATKHR